MVPRGCHSTNHRRKSSECQIVHSRAEPTGSNPCYLDLVRGSSRRPKLRPTFRALKTGSNSCHFIGVRSDLRNFRANPAGITRISTARANVVAARVAASRCTSVAAETSEATVEHCGVGVGLEKSRGHTRSVRRSCGKEREKETAPRPTVLHEPIYQRTTHVALWNVLGQTRRHPRHVQECHDVGSEATDGVITVVETERSTVEQQLVYEDSRFARALPEDVNR